MKYIHANLAKWHHAPKRGPLTSKIVRMAEHNDKRIIAPQIDCCGLNETHGSVGVLITLPLLAVLLIRQADGCEPDTRHQNAGTKVNF